MQGREKQANHCTKELPIDHHHLTVASYNIHLGIGRDGKFEPQRIAAVVKELEADIIALQEVGLGAPGFNMLQYLRDTCGLNAIAGPTMVTRFGDYGNVVLTRFHANTVGRIDLSVPGREPRAALDLQLDCGGHLLRFIATHLGLRPAERRAQIRRLLARIQETVPMPVVLTGDINEWFLWGRPLRWLHRHFGETPGLATFPAGHPLFALDRVWANPRSALTSVAVHMSERARMASDHSPIKAVLDLGVPRRLSVER
jgi:endonuclease/exonuclease/phosphatase family metal-dependent hydrolase